LEPYEPLLTAARREELYRFIDRDGEVLALRADFTPMLARLLAPMLAAAPAAAPAAGSPLALPLRLFYRGDVVRYEEERPGRQREFYQVGAELLGVPGVAAEREMLRLFLALLATTAAAGRGVRVVVGFAGALDRPLAEAAAAGADPAALAAALSRRERAAFSAAAAAGAGWARTLRGVLEEGVPAQAEELGEAAAARFAEVEELVAEMAAERPEMAIGLDLAELADQVLDPALEAAIAGAPAAAAAGERGYYDGLVFRAYAGAVALPAGAGGRYDRLFRRLGAEVPAVGFSLGLDRLGNGGRRRAALAAVEGGR
ncbi:MAG TPA: ATP phosphoribosyltransferase regulatory subunit, partial [Thermoanaerobaculia bacterium]